MSNAISQLFLNMLKEAGMPTTAAEMRAEWEKCVQAENVLIRNNSAWSPFWRLVTAIITLPCQWVVNLLVTHALPNTFLRFAAGGWLDIYAWGLYLTRKPAEFARGQVLFSRVSAGGTLTIPAGTVIETPRLNGKVYQVITTAETVIPNGAMGAYARVEAADAGAAFNLGPGYYSILPKAVPGIVSVTNEADWLISPGADVESDDNLRQRSRNQFAAVGQYHHDAAYKALIADFANIPIDYIFFQKEAPRGPGTANGFIMIDSGPAPAATVDAINTYIMESGNHGHGDDLQCFPMPVLLFDLVVSVYPELDLSNAEKEALALEVENRVKCAFRQNSDFAEITQALPLARFSFSKLGDELHDALPGLRSVEFDQGDIVSYLSLPMLDNLTVAVESGL